MSASLTDRPRHRERLLGVVAAFAVVTPLALLVGVVAVMIEGLAGAHELVRALPWAALASASLVSASLVGVTAVIAVPIGVGAGIWLAEYGRGRGLLTRVLEANVSGLRAVPPVVQGLLGLAVFMRALAGRGELLVGGLTLSLVILPTIADATREAMEAVPSTLRDAGLALGGSRWQIVRQLVYPRASRSIVSGSLLALARAFGEAAPLVVLGLVAGVPLPVWIFHASRQPGPEVRAQVAAAILVMFVVVAGVHVLARRLRTTGEGGSA